MKSPTSAAMMMKLVSMPILSEYIIGEIVMMENPATRIKEVTHMALPTVEKAYRMPSSGDRLYSRRALKYFDIKCTVSSTTIPTLHGNNGCHAEVHLFAHKSPDTETHRKGHKVRGETE